MSRSYKKPIVVLTHKIDKDIAHKQVRRRVKAELDKPEPDEFIIEADTRDLQLEEWGTKIDTTFDPEFPDSTSEEDEKKARRK
jgi:hypothetical protein